MKTYKPMGGESINDAAREMVKLANLTGDVVTAEFNGIPLDTAPGGDPLSIVDSYSEETERRRIEYEASPEYAEQQRKYAEREASKAEALKAALANAPEKPTLLSQEAWDKWYGEQSDPYGQAIFHYAAKWARVMEARMAAGETLEACAEDASRIADDEGITGFMYGAAVSTLAKLWVHGEALRRWHNVKTQIRDEGTKANETSGVLNPALLNIAAR